MLALHPCRESIWEEWASKLPFATIGHGSIARASPNVQGKQAQTG